MHGGAVRVHAALGLTGGPGGVGHHAQVVWSGCQGPRSQSAREHVAPQRKAGSRQFLARRADEIGHRKSRGIFQVIRIGRDDDVFKICRPQQRLDAWI